MVPFEALNPCFRSHFFMVAVGSCSSWSTAALGDFEDKTPEAGASGCLWASEWAEATWSWSSWSSNSGDPAHLENPRSANEHRLRWVLVLAWALVWQVGRSPTGGGIASWISCWILIRCPLRNIKGVSSRSRWLIRVILVPLEALICWWLVVWRWCTMAT